eukprot:TRINITY_DN11580_c0_g1_i1.p3 TRINITY_DN11580_c0_g1~~TRINITY_DN11580_c0_g1_i1.p3  ORF type:complete len:174 (+),score=22.74 TRINITY_DN11580_c0_g1_i1:183-704(+)
MAKAQTRIPTVCESCLDFVNLELLRHYAAQTSGAPPQASLEAIGFRVGTQLAERYARDTARLSEQLEIIKFICKDFWSQVFGKNVDNLKTNHKGTFVLLDKDFRWVKRLSLDSSQSGQNGDNLLKLFLNFPAGIVRGALCQLGVACTVIADASNPPQCNFTLLIAPPTTPAPQ